MHMLQLYVASASTIVTQPANTSASAPFSAVFTCSVSGYGYQNITWYKQSGMLPYKHETTELINDGVITSTLIIPNVTENDVGKYYCQVLANNIPVYSEKAHLYYSGTYVSLCLIYELSSFSIASYVRI